MSVENEYSSQFEIKNSGLRKLLSDARQRLVETGTRNRLVHCQRGTKRGKFIDVVDERSEDIFRILVRQAKRMRFLPDPVDEESDDLDPDEPKLTFTGQYALSDERFVDMNLQTKLGEDQLQKKLLSIARDARTLEEEQGINALYLAIGFLNWFEDESSDKKRNAPLLLVPVTMRRNDTYSTYEVVFNGDELLTNEPLKLRLLDDQGIRLPDVPEDENWTPDSYFSKVADAISAKPRWSIDRDGMQLGFFSFAKLLMVKDLEPDNWPDASILKHELVAGLLGEGFAPLPRDFAEDANLDDLFDPANLIQVVDADSSQTRVIETVRLGRNLVVQGPPGTGKSQTITNIIAAAVHDGKKVLFMAEKMAALNVVHDRLKKAGLDNMTLELHSRQANKKLVVEELGRTLAAGRSVPNIIDQAADLRQVRDSLNRLSHTLHSPIGESSLTAYEVLSRLIALRAKGFTPSELILPDSTKWTVNDLSEIVSAVTAFTTILDQAGNMRSHPFFGIRQANLLPMDVDRLKLQITQFIPKLDELIKQADAIKPNLGFEGPLTFDQYKKISIVLQHFSQLQPGVQPYLTAIARYGDLSAVQSLIQQAKQLFSVVSRDAGIYNRSAFTTDVRTLREPLASGVTFFGRMKGSYKAASLQLQGLLAGPLPGKAEDRLALVDGLIVLQAAHNSFQALRTSGQQVLGSLWQDYSSDFSKIEHALSWLLEIDKIGGGANIIAIAATAEKYDPHTIAKTGSTLSDQFSAILAETQNIFKTLSVDLENALDASSFGGIELPKLRGKMQRWNSSFERLDEWGRMLIADKNLRIRDLSGLADALADGLIPTERAVDTVIYAHAESLYRVFVAEHPEITKLTAEQRNSLVLDFQARDKDQFDHTSRSIRAGHLASLPAGAQGAMGVIRGEIAKKRSHKPIRRLMQEAGPALQQIKPVLLMSPISVAQFLRPGVIEFDLLVIDEASQVRPEDALGAVARVKQIVVVGDSKQLPPTSFFDRMMSDEIAEREPEDEDEIPAPTPPGAAELESVLTLCNARGLNEEMLRWHYRSRHPSLIEVSNETFYGGSLILPPAPVSEKTQTGLFINRVSGAYDRGGKRNNRIEADNVVKAVAVHARKYPEQSLGVVTFSTAQRDLITELLELARRDDPQLDIFLREGMQEDFFVKNLENVQGDERDVIMISIGYGPRIAGTPLDSMAFGPVSREGGERRLNVLFTRARDRTEVFASFDPGDINLARTKMEGARILKRYLQYAESGVLHVHESTGKDPDSDFEISVANAVRGMGYDVDYQIGSAGFRIDLAVHNPAEHGKYLLAVECDGATYHSALWARERDRLRQEVLEGMGWAFHRVWSTDWFHRRNEEIERLRQALLKAQETNLTKAPGANVGSGPKIEEQDLETPVDVGIEVEPTSVESIDQAELSPAPSALPPYELADFDNSHICEPHELEVGKMADFVQKIIDVEGPVHEEEISRRVASLFGKLRTGARISDSTVNALRHMGANQADYFNENRFWGTKRQFADPPLRNRSDAPQTLRRADMLPPPEIAAAIRRTLEENGGLAETDIPRAVALLFGFLRTGPEFKPAIEPVIARLKAEGAITEAPSGLIVNGIL